MKSWRLKIVALTWLHGGHQIAPQYRNTGLFSARAAAKAASTSPFRQAMPASRGPPPPARVAPPAPAARTARRTGRRGAPRVGGFRAGRKGQQDHQEACASLVQHDAPGGSCVPQFGIMDQGARDPRRACVRAPGAIPVRRRPRRRRRRHRGARSPVEILVAVRQRRFRKRCCGNRGRPIPARAQIQFARRREWPPEIRGRFVQRAHEVARPLGASQRNPGEHGVREHVLPEPGRVGLLRHDDPRAPGQHRIERDREPTRNVVVRLDANGIAVVVHEQVAVERHVALALEQGLVAVLVEEIAVDRIIVLRTPALAREMAHQHVGARGRGQTRIGLGEHVVAKDRHAPPFRHARECRAAGAWCLICRL